MALPASTPFAAPRTLALAWLSVAAAVLSSASAFNCQKGAKTSFPRHNAKLQEIHDKTAKIPACDEKAFCVRLKYRVGWSEAQSATIDSWRCAVGKEAETWQKECEALQPNGAKNVKDKTATLLAPEFSVEEAYCCKKEKCDDAPPPGETIDPGTDSDTDGEKPATGGDKSSSTDAGSGVTGAGKGSSDAGGQGSGKTTQPTPPLGPGDTTAMMSKSGVSVAGTTAVVLAVGALTLAL